MNKQKIIQGKRLRRKMRVRAKIIGTALRPRLSVFKSNKSIYAQLIDDSAGKTLVSASAKEITKQDKKTAIGFELGRLLAAKAKEKKIELVVFDRSCYKYHGRIKSFADGAREGGLKF